MEFFPSAESWKGIQTIWSVDQSEYTYLKWRQRGKTRANGSWFTWLVLVSHLFEWQSWVGFFQANRLTTASKALPNCEIMELKHARFWDANGNRKWAIFTFNCPHTTKFPLLSIFSLLEMSIKIRSWHAKCSLPVAVHVSETRVLKFPNLSTTLINHVRLVYTKPNFYCKRWRKLIPTTSQASFSVWFLLYWYISLLPNYTLQWGL